MQLTKHHGLGNDFLVLLDTDDHLPINGDLARPLCDRRRGVGADGLIRVGPGTGGADVTMELYNADGGRAEMSGNGIRCLGQAVAMARGQRTLSLDVATDGGLRRLEIHPGPDDTEAHVEVDMGPVGAGPDVGFAWDAEFGPLPVKTATADVGNPHLVVLVDDVASVDLARTGPGIEAFHPGGINVEFIEPGPAANALTLRVWERGAGITQACGTGACAAAHAAHAWGLVGDKVLVHMPGGDVEVVLGPSVTLIGPAVYIATMEVPWR